MADRLGKQLGNYRLTRLLGQGGFAEVYLGEHTLLLGTTVAIKVLHTRVSQEDVAKFQEEASLLASLRHPHIIRLLDFGLDGQTPYLVMDHAPNGTLRTRHAEETPLPISIVVDYVKQIAGALQYAHDRKVIHRDVKPANMLIGEKNEILLSDFGIALISHTSHYQSKKDMAGTVAYMAPEQIDAHPRLASDQYSLGIVAYEWLCGTRPFHGSYMEIAIKHKVTPPIPLREHIPTLSPDVEHVVLTALAKRPEDRFASVSAFATALEQASRDLLPNPMRTLPSDTVAVSAPALPSYLPTEILDKTAASSHPSVPVPDTSAPEKMTGKPAVSRRTAIAGIAGVVAVAAVAGSIFIVSRQHSQGLVGAQSSQTVTPQVPTATPQNQPFTYRGHSDSVHGVAWSPLDGKRIASASFDKTVKVWNASDGSDVFTYRGHSDRVARAVWSPDEKRIASGSYDKTVQVWNASNGGNVFTYKGHSDAVGRVAWSPDGKRIASGSYDKTVQVWNASNGGNVFTYKGHSDVVLAVAWSPLDGKRIASGSADNTVQVWNASDGGNVFTYKGHSDLVNALAWSPLDGKRIASSSADNTVQVWNASDGGNVFTYKGHSDHVFGVAWSPDGKWIASSSVDKTVQVWNASDGGNVFIYKGHTAQVWSVAWSPDGKLIASCSDDNTVQVWHVV